MLTKLQVKNGADDDALKSSERLLLQPSTLILAGTAVTSDFHYSVKRAKGLSMGCIGSSEARNQTGARRKKVRKPQPWAHTEPITRAQLMRMREEFWDTSPHYGGQREIWDVLRAAAEAPLKMAQVYIDTAGVIVENRDLTVCYDERGARYELPYYVLSEPTNLIRQ